ncbi:hypothetical protein SRHO_G00270520 [Serrasalmus rhombeus]
MHVAAPAEEHDVFCEKAVALIVDLCLDDSPLLDTDTCQDFLVLLTNHSHDISSSDKSTVVWALSCLPFRQEGRGGFGRRKPQALMLDEWRPAAGLSSPAARIQPAKKAKVMQWEG